MAMKKATVYIPMLLQIITMPLATTQSLELVYRGRSGNQPGDNRIFLDCQRGGVAVTTPEIFVERLDLPRQLVTIAGNQRGQVTIVITQELEGMYSCSDSGDRSTNTLELVAYPQPKMPPSSYTIQAGSPVTIDCQIMPGRLGQHYSVTWWKASVTIARSNPHNVSPGYQLHDNFSLTINDAHPSDSSTNYRCSVTIDDPRRSGTDNVVYDQLDRITVIVYERPTIQTPPRPRVEVIDANREREVTFSCTAHGGPGLTLSWTHNVNSIGSTGSGKYRVNGTTEDRSATSMLTMNTLRSADSGIIGCTATVRVFKGESETPETFTASTSTFLSVLAGDFDLDVDITTEGDMLLQLRLMAPIPEEVQLRIKYISSKEPDSVESLMRTSNEAFINASRITADVRNSDVPYQRFKVQVALMVDNQQGPFVPKSVNSAPTYDKSQTTQVDNTRDIIIAAVVGGLGLGLIVVIPVVVVAYCCYKTSKSHRLAENAQAKTGRVFDQVDIALRDPNVTSEKFKMHLEFINKALPNLNPVRTDADAEEENLDPQIQKDFLEFLDNILRGGKRDKLIGPKIIKIIKEVFGKELADGSIGGGMAEVTKM